MCGIYGLVGREGESERERALARMSACLEHRGPDGDGRLTARPASLGCRRLAIVDVAGGAQPLASEKGTVIAVCNGEIYNQAALRHELEARGHRFRTRSDAEVLPHLYEEKGPEFVHSLEGMFGLALWDRERARLVLARDRMGEKPLYYALTPGGLIFASEPKAIVSSGLVRTEPDWSALSAYLRLGYIPGTASAFSRIARLPPGGRLVLEGEAIDVQAYWQVAPLLAASPVELEFAEAARELKRHLVRAVRAALMSDVPLGVFLSGGLDSTVVAALARANGGDLATFALGFPVPGFDERDYAALVARKLGTRHRTLTITPELFLEGVRELGPLLDEPLADPALVPTYLLARFARSEVKVALSGEGGDELFAGYPTYPGGILAARYARLPAWLRRTLLRAAPLLGAPRGNTTLRFMLRRFLEAAEAPAAERHRRWVGCISPERLASLVTPGGPLAEPPPSSSLPPACSTLDALLALDLTGYLPDDLLHKIDRAMMAASLEGRAPFLDRRLVEFACRLPAAYKLRGASTKRILRRAAAELVPAEIRRRIKRGLTVPLATWLAGPLLPFARAALEKLDPRIVRPQAVAALLADHVERRRDNRRELWALIVLSLWAERWTAR